MFVPDGGDLVATVLTQGPWDPSAQHGGPVCAALARTLEAVPTLVPMQVARFTFELFRAVPIRRLGAAARVVREGKRLQLVEAVLRDGDLEVARGTALRLRIGDTPEALEHPGRPVRTAPPRRGSVVRPLPEIASRIGFLRAIEIERVGGAPGRGPTGTTWYRTRVPIVAGEEATPMQRLALFSDFTSASALYLHHSEWSAINPDVTVQVLRPPTGDWICLTCETEASGVGIGHSRSTIFDDDGFVASGSTAQLIDRVRSPFA